jgi:hypothetical protein
VALHEDRIDFPMSGLCQNGIGAGAAAYTGDLALAANAVYSFTDVTFNATAIANLDNLAGSTIIICFSGTLLIPPVVPVNLVPESLLPLKLAPRPPATLLFISTQAPSGAKPKVVFGLPTGVSVTTAAEAGAISVGGSAGLNLDLGLPVSMSGVVYAPNADCTAHGHVDLYGAVVCGSLNAKAGMNVHYDTQLGHLPFDQPVRVSAWTEG